MSRDWQHPLEMICHWSYGRTRPQPEMYYCDMGVGKVRHLQVKHLCMQENVAEGEMVIVKVPRVDNCADGLTHLWGVSDQPFWEMMGLCFIPRV